MGITKRGVQIALGILWLLDGVLQLQHQMFTSAFVSQVIRPTESGQPTFVTGPINFGVHIFLLHPAIFNGLFALTQIAIGTLILWRKTLRQGLILSVLWGLIVWIFGEGYGGIFSGHTLLLMGAPGAALIYVLLSLAVLPKSDEKNKDKSQIAYWIVFVWLVIWVGGGIYQLLPGQNSTMEQGTMIVGNADGAPTWLSKVDTKTGNFINNLGNKEATVTTPTQIANKMNMTGTQMTHMTVIIYSSSSSNGYWFILLTAVLQCFIGIGALIVGSWRKTAIYLGIGLALVFWLVGENLGGYYTGFATDPNSGPLLILLGLAILGCKDLDKKLTGFTKLLTIKIVGKSTTA